MMNLASELIGNDLRTTGNANTVIKKINSQSAFDELFELMFHENRVLAMHAADIAEKVTAHHPHYLSIHKDDLLKLVTIAQNKELLWHVAQLLPRIEYNNEEQQFINMHLLSWVRNQSLSRIVRVNALQALFEFAEKDLFSKHALKKIMNELKKEHIPSLDARIKAILKKLPACKGGGNCSCCSF